MKMDRFFTGLVALVAGLALSAGSAFATKGYLAGDTAPAKLVPHYEIGDSKATIIGVYNMSPGDNDSAECQSAAGVALDAVADANDPAASALCLIDHDRDPRTPLELPGATDTGATRIIDALGGGFYTEAQQLLDANAQANADDATNLIVTAVVYGPSGTEQADAEICLAPGAYGYFVLEKMASDMMDGVNGARLSMADGIGIDGMMTSVDDAGRTISEPMHVYNGYVVVTASHRVVHCDGRSTPSDEAVKVKQNSDPIDAASRDNLIVNPEIAAWTIVQDVGEGFFGTEVPTPTVNMMRGEGKVVMADSMDLDCYDTDDNDVPGTEDAQVATRIERPDTEFNMSKCGLIPERHNNDRISANEAGGLYPEGAPDTRRDDTALDGTTNLLPDTANVGNGHATPRAAVSVRYDTMDDTTVFAWMGSPGTMLDVYVVCEEGMEDATIDNPASNIPTDELNFARLSVSGHSLMIDPSMGEIGRFTRDCDAGEEGGRGVLHIRMPEGSGAGMLWSHIAQMDDHYRMNFPGYSMASPGSCRAAVSADAVGPASGADPTAAQAADRAMRINGCR